MADVKKPPLKNAADILVLIGTIFTTLGVIFGFGFLVLMYAAETYGYGYGYGYHGWPYFYMYQDWLPILIIGIVVVLVSVVFLVLSWVAYSQTVKNSTGWAIYGLVQAILSGAVLSIVGYVLALVHLHTEPKPVLQSNTATSVDENIKLTSQLAAAKAELEALKAAKAFRESQQAQNNTVSREKNPVPPKEEAGPYVVEAPAAEVSEEAAFAEEAKQAE